MKGICDVVTEWNCSRNVSGHVGTNRDTHVGDGILGKNYLTQIENSVNSDHYHRKRGYGYFVTMN